MYKVSRPDYMATISALTDIEFVNTPGSFNVTSVNLLKPPTKEGYNVNATVVLKNPTPFSVEMVCLHGYDPQYLDYTNSIIGLRQFQSLHGRLRPRLHRHP